MRKPVALFLTAVFLLNILGFYGVFLGVKFQTAAESIRALNNNNYSSESEVTFAVPLTVPYYTNNDSEFQRVDGQFEHDGEVFRMVKQKLHRDTLYVVCIKDRAGKEINQAMENYVKTFTDKPVDSKHPGVKMISFSKDYVSTLILIESAQHGWSTLIATGERADLYTQTEIIAIDSPPRA